MRKPAAVSLSYYLSRLMRKLHMRILYTLVLLTTVLFCKGQAANEYEVDLAQGATATGATFSALGNWRGIFTIRPGIEVPFNFEIRPGRDGATELFFHNASESFEGGRIRQTEDSLFVALDQFDNELAFRITDGALNGVLRHQNGTG